MHQQETPRRETEFSNRDHVPAPDEVMVDLLGYIVVDERTPFERIEHYSDKYPALGLRKSLQRINHSIRHLCRLIIYSSLFEGLIILVILANSVTLAVQGNSSESVYEQLDRVFMCIYTAECVMKVRDI